MAKPESFLVVTRRDPTDIQIRDFYLQVDDQDRMVLRYDRSVRFPLPEGSHCIRVINGYTTLEEEFTLTPGETVRFAVSMHYTNRFLSVIALVLGGAVLSRASLRRETDPEPPATAGVS